MLQQRNLSKCQAQKPSAPGPKMVAAFCEGRAPSWPACLGMKLTSQPSSAICPKPGKTKLLGPGSGPGAATECIVARGDGAAGARGGRRKGPPNAALCFQACYLEGSLSVGLSGPTRGHPILLALSTLNIRVIAQALPCRGSENSGLPGSPAEPGRSPPRCPRSAAAGGPSDFEGFRRFGA